MVCLGLGKLALFLAFLAGLGLFGGAWVASGQSSFCVRCHPGHEAIWKSSTHRTVECVGCHVAPGWAHEVESKIHSLRNVGVFLRQGVEVVPGETPLPIARESCQGCHASILRVNEIGYSDLPPNSLQLLGLKPAHRLHVVDHQIDCVWCHRGVAHRDPAQIGKYDRNVPTHEDCMVCHDAQVSERFQIAVFGVEDEIDCFRCHPAYQPPYEG
ncbi:MAG: hypothetical protein BWZ10_02448 [candidate division BRC1 bacterium ADurb.BinA364]|nr:MAG: hypothetical protein BWZ10_02448 [candidate division BRC1 bacterium ADurb.BinA364]